MPNYNTNSDIANVLSRLQEMIEKRDQLRGQANTMAKVADKQEKFKENLQSYLGIESEQLEKFIETVQRDAEIDHESDIPIPEHAAFAIETHQVQAKIVPRASPRLKRHEFMVKLAEHPQFDSIYQRILDL